jgi:hypothetical protein
MAVTPAAIVFEPAYKGGPQYYKSFPKARCAEALCDADLARLENEVTSLKGGCKGRDMIAWVYETLQGIAIQVKYSPRSKDDAYLLRIPYALIRDKGTTPKIYAYVLFTGHGGEHSKLIFEEDEYYDLIHREDGIGTFWGYKTKEKKEKDREMRAVVTFKEPGSPEARSVDLAPYLDDRGWIRALARVNATNYAERRAQRTPIPIEASLSAEPKVIEIPMAKLSTSIPPNAITG